MWCCFDLIKAKGEGRRLKCNVRFDGFRSRSTHPTDLHGFALVPKLQLGNPYSEAPASLDRKLLAAGVQASPASASKACTPLSILNNDVALTFCLSPCTFNLF
jgi:hypothetical protein